MPALIVQEVLTEGGPFREQFIEQFAGRLAPLLVAVVRREQAAGTVRADVEPRLAALSAISLIVFPFLALPVAGRVLGLSVEDEAVERLAAHTTRVLMEGIGAPERVDMIRHIACATLLAALATGCSNGNAPREVHGTLERDRLEIVAESNERIVEIAVHEGERVEAGSRAAAPGGGHHAASP